jgi:hypothetical protein
MVCSLHRERCQSKKCHPKLGWFRNEKERGNSTSKGGNHLLFLFTTTKGEEVMYIDLNRDRLEKLYDNYK